MIMEHILFFGNFVVHHWYRWLSLIMYMMLGISLGHDLRVGGQLRSAHTHPPCGWEPRCEGMSPGLGWLTHTSDRLWCLDSGWRWDVVFFDTQGVCKNLQCFLEQEKKLHQSIFLVTSVGLRWDLHFGNETVHDLLPWSCCLEEPDTKPLRHLRIAG